MSLEKMSDVGRPKENPVALERSQTLEEVFNKYHKDMVKWCGFKLRKDYWRHNVKSDAEEIVAFVYERLLKDKVSIDLTRTGAEVRNFLNMELDKAIVNFSLKIQAQKRIPVQKQESLEQILEDKDEEDLEAKLKDYFLSDNKEGEEKQELEKMYEKIETAISKIKEVDERLMDIIRKRFQEKKTLRDIAQEYGVSGELIRVKEEKALNIIRDVVAGKTKKLERLRKYKET